MPLLSTFGGASLRGFVQNSKKFLIDFTIVGGGGSGAYGYATRYGGGGGGGGYLLNATNITVSGQISVIVGGGGSFNGGTGSASSFWTYSRNGGNGGTPSNTIYGGPSYVGSGGAGGSGGGNGGYYDWGQNGGVNGSNSGGAGQGTTTYGVNGVLYSYGGGGGGGYPDWAAGNQANASANTGNGGAGGWNIGTLYLPGNGGSGIVVVRYQGSTQKATGGSVSISGGYVYHTFTSSGTFTIY